MQQEDFDTAIRQLAAAADLLAAQAAFDQRMNAQQLRAFFLMQEKRAYSPGLRQTSNDELFMATAAASLEMAGRKEYLAAAALLDQARSLL